jgi:hypothetical protein
LFGKCEAFAVKPFRELAQERQGLGARCTIIRIARKQAGPVRLGAAAGDPA